MEIEQRMELNTRVRVLSAPGCSLLLGYLLSKFMDEPNANFWFVLDKAMQTLFKPRKAQ